MSALIIERALASARLSELGVPGWPLWKDPIGVSTQHYDAVEKSYFLTGEAILSCVGQEPLRASSKNMLRQAQHERNWLVYERPFTLSLSKGGAFRGAHG